MKKYIAPAINVVALNTEDTILAGSKLSVNNGLGVGEASNKNIFIFEEWEECFEEED